MVKCQFCGYDIDRRGCLGTESKYHGGWTHRGCLENHLLRKRSCKNR